MALALSDLLKRLTRDEVLSSMLSIADSLGLKTTAWQPGQPGRTLLVIVAQRIADATATLYEIAAGGLLEYATAGWLTLLARNVYNVERREAEFATGTTAAGNPLTLTNGSGADLGPFPAGDLVFAHSVTGKTYRNLALVPIFADGASVDVDIMAEEAGTGSDAAPGMITALVTTTLGLTCTNAASILGADEQTDEELRDECREKLGSLSPNGPAEAFAYVAKNADTSSPITRTLVTASTTTGVVTVYCATATGAPGAPDVAIVQSAIDASAEPLCVQATAVGAAELTVPVTLEVWVKGTSLSPAEISSAISTALATYFRDLDIGGVIIPPATLGKVDVDAIKGVVFQSTAGVVDVAITLPAADVSVAPNEVPKLGAVNITVTTL